MVNKDSFGGALSLHPRTLSNDEACTSLKKKITVLRDIIPSSHVCRGLYYKRLRNQYFRRLKLRSWWIANPELHAPFFGLIPQNCHTCWHQVWSPPMIPIFHDRNVETREPFRKIPTALRKKIPDSYIFFKRSSYMASPCFAVPFPFDLSPTPDFNLEFLAQTLRWRDWSQVEDFQLLEFVAPEKSHGFLFWICWKTCCKRVEIGGWRCWC